MNLAPVDRVVLPVLGVPIDVLTTEHALARIGAWAHAHESRVVCLCNVHSVVTASRDASFLQVVSEADMTAPDGAPVAWMLRRQGATQQVRVSGPDLMLAYCDRLAQTGETIFFYGSTPATLENLRRRLREHWPKLRVAGMIAPPFGVEIIMGVL